MLNTTLEICPCCTESHSHATECVVRTSFLRILQLKNVSRICLPQLTRGGPSLKRGESALKPRLMAINTTTDEASAMQNTVCPGRNPKRAHKQPNTTCRSCQSYFKFQRVRACVCVCVCVRERERERAREREHKCQHTTICKEQSDFCCIDDCQ